MRKTKIFGIHGTAFAPQTAAAASGLAIRDVRAAAVQEPDSKRRYIILQIDTDAGVTGIGETGLGSNPANDLARIPQVKDTLVGADALSYELVDVKLNQVLGDDGFAARMRGGVNMALHDILGKKGSATLLQALGGRTRDRVRAYTDLLGSTTEELLASLLRAKERGFKAFSVPVNLPPPIERGRQGFVAIRAQLEKLFAAAGDDCDLILDCAGKLTPGEAASITISIEDLYVLWMDEPTEKVNSSAFGKITRESVVPVGMGRSITNLADFQDLLREGSVESVRLNLSLLGVTGARKAAAIAETYYVAVAPYNALGPVGTAAGVHLAAALPNFFIQQVPNGSDRDLAMRAELISGGTIEKAGDGFLSLPTEPGLSVAINQDALRQYALRG